MSQATRNVVLFLACVVVVVFLSPIFKRDIAAFQSVDADSSNASIIDIKGEISRISDGDTLQVKVDEITDQSELDAVQAEIATGDKLKIRMHGIDAPEIRQLCMIHAQPFKCGVTATNILKEMTRGKRLGCDLREKDRYGRWVAVCYIEGVSIDAADISRAMVLRGYALAYVKYSRDYVDVEDEAKRMQHGLWESGVEWITPSDYRKEIRNQHKHTDN